MNFASYDFWRILFLCFLASRILIAAAKAVSPELEHRTSKVCLAATALVLLGAESLLTLGCFLWVVFLGWTCVRLRDTALPPRPRLVLFGLLLVAQVVPLFYFKYWNFFFNEILGIDARVPSVLIPMGLSFYTFQTVGFWIDHSKSRAPAPAFLDYLNFSSFFPQIVAGPIEKKELLLPQIEATGFRIHRENLEAALQWIVLGLAYKLIVADNLASLSDKFHVDPSNAWHVWFECLAFGIRIYFDFAGYSFIALGLGLLFGVKLTLNFRCPYWAQDMREFWRNWHVTLGAWLRDYIYIPLGGKRVRWWAVNTLLVFVVSGIWHGAGWGFLIWGLMHGVGVAVCAVEGNWMRFAPVRWAITFAYTTAAWLFFLERDSTTLLRKAASLVAPDSYLGDAGARFSSVFTSQAQLATTGLVLFLAAAALVLEKIGLLRSKEPYGMLRNPIAAFVLVLLIVLLAPLEESSFIYFNF